MMKSQIVIFTLLNVLLISNASPSARIVGGSMVTLGQIPSQLSLRTLANFHFCGGTLIAGRWAITTAACTIGRGHNSINVVGGTVRLDTGGQTQRSMRIIQNPEYNHLTLANDLSLIQTERDFVLSANIGTINLGIANLLGGVNVQLSGYGATQASGPLSNDLRRVNTQTITNAVCSTRLIGFGFQVFNSKLCTHTRGQGACTGDQGGPVIDTSNQLVAVKSWFIPCAADVPDGHERISSHRTWILSIIS